MRKRYNKLKLNFHEGYFDLRQTSSKLKENYRGANLIKVLFYFPYLISILLLNGCSPQQTVLPSPQPNPWFVKSSMPPDGSTIIYKPISEICIEIRTSAIVQSGDHFNDAETIIDKLSLTFNGQNISISPEVSHELASTEIEYPDGSLASNSKSGIFLDKLQIFCLKNRQNMLL